MADVAVDQERGHHLLHVGAGAARVDALREEGVHAGRVAVVEVGQQVLQVVVVEVAVLEGKRRNIGNSLAQITTRSVLTFLSRCSRLQCLDVGYSWLSTLDSILSRTCAEASPDICFFMLSLSAADMLLAADLPTTTGKLWPWF